MSRPQTGDGRTAVTRELDHTADVALLVTAQSLPDLFAGAALGMVRMLAGDDLSGGREEKVLVLEDVDHESLLVNWLNALLSLSDTEGFVPTSVVVTLSSGPRLKATIRGLRGAPQRLHAKAATFHMLAITRRAGSWRTTVVFDV
jgi:SHS2 domain-containing protein